MAVQHQKSLSIDLLLPKGLSSSDPRRLSSPAFESEPSGACRPTTQPLSRRKGGARSPDLLDVVERQDQQRHVLRVDGRLAHVALTASGLEWWPCAAGAAPASVESVPFSEMLSAQCRDPGSPGLLSCLKTRAHRLEVFTFRRAPGRPCKWSPRRLRLEAGDEETVQDLATAVSRGIAGASAARPKSLLVLLNPNSGHRQGRRVWRNLAAPVLAAAGVKVTVWETRRAGHASELVAELSEERLRGLDGVLCVGGDGVFHEALNGLMAARSAAAAAGNDELAAALAALRLAHIPAGSTDAVACTLHGTRSAFAAAMHVALGDSTPLDVLRVDTPQGTKFASCIAAYGFLADVTSEAERYRWLGPARYDLVGAAKLAVSRAYPARIRYLEGEVGRALSKHSHAACASACGVCRAASFMHANRLSQRHLAASASAADELGDACSSPGSSHPASPVARGGWQGTHVAAAAAIASSLSSVSVGGSGGRSQPQTPTSRRARTGPAAAGAAAAGREMRAELAASEASVSSLAPPFLQPAAGAAERHVGEEWQEIEGEFVSIMLIVMPCRSDKTKAGMARYGHLADGRIKLVLVRRCSPLQYLRFLHSMSRQGCAPGQLPHVQVLDAVAVEVTPAASHSAGNAAHHGRGGAGGSVHSSGSSAGPPVSCWNLDGELVAGPGMCAEVHHGLIRVFSRGVEG